MSESGASFCEALEIEASWLWIERAHSQIQEENKSMCSTTVPQCVFGILPTSQIARE